MEFLEAGRRQGTLSAFSLDRAPLGSVTVFARGVAWLVLPFVLLACHDGEKPPQVEAYAYPHGPPATRCEADGRTGLARMRDGKVVADGVPYHVRTPSNYDATFAHPLLMVYAAAGQSGRETERMTGLTPTATGAGFIVAYVDHRPLGVSAIEQLGALPGAIAKQWCVDEHRVYITGHSDGGTATLALALLDRTKHVPAAVAPSAAGWTQKDLEAYQCRDPLPIMIMHGKNDRLFPGWGAQTAAWWAACNHCSAAETKQVDGGCLAYKQCDAGGATLYCEGAVGHRDWLGLNRVMIEFFSHPEKFL